MNDETFLAPGRCEFAVTSRNRAALVSLRLSDGLEHSNGSRRSYTNRDQGDLSSKRKEHQVCRKYRSTDDPEKPDQKFPGLDIGLVGTGVLWG